MVTYALHAQLAELAGLVGGEVDALAVGREPRVAEEHRLGGGVEARQRLGREIERVELRLGDRHRAGHQQGLAVGREILRRPLALFLQHRHARLAIERGDVDIDILAVAPCGREGEPAAVAREQRRGVARLAVGEQRRLAAGDVEVMELEELVAAGVLGEHEAVLPGVWQRTVDGLGIEGELLARAHGLRHTVDLRRLAEARADQRAAVRQPAAEGRRAHLLVSVEAFGELGGDVRDALHHQVAALDALDFRRGLGRHCRAHDEPAAECRHPPLADALSFHVRS